MAFNTIPSAWIDVSDPLKKELFDYVKDNFDDHETRIAATESGANKIIIYDGILCNATSSSSLTGIMFGRAAQDITITDAKLFIFDVSGISSGTLEIDVRKSTSPDFTSDSSIFTTKPSFDFSTASNYTETSNANISAGSVSSGDYMRIDVTSLPSTTIGKFGIYVIAEAA